MCKYPLVLYTPSLKLHRFFEEYGELLMTSYYKEILQQEFAFCKFHKALQFCMKFSSEVINSLRQFWTQNLSLLRLSIPCANRKLGEVLKSEKT